jgi:hypothetical protein
MTFPESSVAIVACIRVFLLTRRSTKPLGSRTRSPKRKMDPLMLDRQRDAVLAIGPGLKGQRDRAMLLLAFACASRQSEITGSTSPTCTSTAAGSS